MLLWKSPLLFYPKRQKENKNKTPSCLTMTEYHPLFPTLRTTKILRLYSDNNTIELASNFLAQNGLRISDVYSFPNPKKETSRACLFLTFFQVFSIFF